MKPLLQVALDITDREKALRLAAETANFVDIIEAGTPLIKTVGLSIVRELKRLFPKKSIVADMKTADVGALEAKLAFEAGADLTTVLGSASLFTIEEAILEAKIHGKKVMVDLIGVEDKLTRAQEIQRLNPDYIGIHTGIDEQVKGKSPFQNIRELIKLKVPLAVAGGIKLENLERLREFKPAIIIVGGGIIRKEKPGEAAKAIKEKINELWPQD
ncbi:MAG: orotidine 5'-phosphate decarboxylase [Actinomycetota bacterium]|nr:orotidine 5'-phosphate decarboxylase [Actinomycetota bacterium]MDI6821733.1 orotidine 5'-phosphate decarboxylase [Actinomycetota bacterium]